MMRMREMFGQHPIGRRNIQARNIRHNTEIARTQSRVGVWPGEKLRLTKIRERETSCLLFDLEIGIPVPRMSYSS